MPNPSDKRLEISRPKTKKLQVVPKAHTTIELSETIARICRTSVVLRSSFIETSHGASYQLNIVVPERCQSNEVLIPTNISFATTLWDVQALISQ